MNGVIFMNKEISVQYAYKKDGKGERHGDSAERMLAAQARKHNVQPSVQPLPPQLLAAPTPSAPPVIPPAVDPRMMNGTPPVHPSGFAPPPATYHNVPPPTQQRPPPPVTPLPPPPSGLPARPPPSNAGYGGPTNFPMPGFGGAAPQAPPPGFPTPPGFVPPGQAAPGTLPPGFQQPPTYNRR
jgi:splicing factor 3B subunit 4